MNPNPTCVMQRATASGFRSIRAPSASSTSAEPLSPVALRLPCLATAHPAPAAISAAVVETLNVARPPPVPAVSSRSSRSQVTGVASERIVAARPASSSTVSPFVRSAIRNPAIWVSVALPSMITRRTSPACSIDRSWPDASASIAFVRVGSGKEVFEELLPGVGEDRLGMELDALGGQLAVADRHQHAATMSGGLEAVRQRVLADDERVVAPHDERGFDAGEDGPAVVLGGRGLAVHRIVADDLAAEGLRERLMAEADAERRHARLREALHDVEAYARLVGRARPRRHDHAVVAATEQVVDVGAVVAHDLELASHLPQVLDEVVGERVVVVDHQDAHQGQSGCLAASSMAFLTPRAFATDSSYSYSGLASATVPPPAWMCAKPSLITTVRMWMQVSRSPV